VGYRPLFSGPAVDRVAELQFQRPARDVELAREDLQRLRLSPGQPVDVRSNGTSVQLRARVALDLPAGTARIADEHAEGLEGRVEVRA
jgi:anaerobic selenocysteine-containing dehydrogenase